MQQCVILKNGNIALIDSVNHDAVMLPRSMLCRYTGQHLSTDSEHAREHADGTKHELSKKAKEQYRAGFTYGQTKESAGWEPNTAFNDRGHSDKYVMAKVLNVPNSRFQPLSKSKIAVNKDGPNKGKYVTVDIKDIPAYLAGKMKAA